MNFLLIRANICKNPAIETSAVCLPYSISNMLFKNLYDAITCCAVWDVK